MWNFSGICWNKTLVSHWKFTMEIKFVHGKFPMKFTGIYSSLLLQQNCGNLVLSLLYVYKKRGYSEMA